eukprot:UC1_evm1s1667
MDDGRSLYHRSSQSYSSAGLQGYGGSGSNTGGASSITSSASGGGGGDTSSLYGATGSWGVGSVGGSVGGSSSVSGASNGAHTSTSTSSVYNTVGNPTLYNYLMQQVAGSTMYGGGSGGGGSDSRKYIEAGNVRKTEAAAGPATVMTGRATSTTTNPRAGMMDTTIPDEADAACVVGASSSSSVVIEEVDDASGKATPLTPVTKPTASVTTATAAAATTTSTVSTASSGGASDGQVVLGHTASISSAEMSQMVVTAEDREYDPADFPVGATDVNGQQVDLRRKHSWLLELSEVSTGEAAEVLAINTLAPFVLNSKLKPLMQCSPAKHKFIINVSAMEGKFYRYKSTRHPHTNMAKAALNMMTRTSAADYVRSGIYMTAVDTGWINDEKPVHAAREHQERHNFQTPIDEIDAAARVLDPMLAPLAELDAGRECKPPWGALYKDYEKTEW